jgi:protein gp37
MAHGSGIEWTDATWNPVAGCTILSPGCTNCYAMRMAARLQAMGLPKYAGTTRKSGKRHVWTGRIRLDPDSLEAPLRWRKPRLVFVNSMSDLFHEAVPATFVGAVWDTMERASDHQFQVLTKRPDRLAEFVASRRKVLPNVWLGTSVETPAYLERIDVLRRVPAAVRFISFEPLLARVQNPNLRGIDWAIVGGESGPGARPMAENWVEDLLLASQRHSTQFFFKQWGGPIKKRAGRVFRGRVWEEMPTPKKRRMARAA